MNSTQIEKMSSYEKRFSYIKNDTLRKHMGDALEFIANILVIADTYTSHEKNLFYKTAILYTASLIESHIHYLLLYHNCTHITNLKKRHYKDVKDLYPIDDERTIGIYTKNRPTTSLKHDTVKFIDLNRAAQKHNIYNKKIFKNVEYVRKLRNTIHLMKLEDIDRTYSQSQLNNVFATADDIFRLTEETIAKTTS